MSRLDPLRRVATSLSQVQVPARIYWFILFVVAVVGFGFFANPWVVSPSGMDDRVGEGILIVEGLVGIACCTAACIRRMRSPHSGPIQLEPETNPKSDPPYPPLSKEWQGGVGPSRIPSQSAFWPRALVTALFFYIVVLWLAMFCWRVRDPKLSSDDATYVAIASNWESTWENLFTPFAEHLCVITRIFTWAVCASFDQENWPRALAYGGMTLFAATFVPLFWFVRKEWNSPVLGLVAVSLFAITTVHGQVVTWYSASQWCWALLLLFASILVLQAGESAPRKWQLALSAVLAAIGPLNYAVGLLIGPLSAAYLALCRRPRTPSLSYRRCAIPLIGTAAFLAGFIPSKAPQIIAEASYGGRPAAEAIAPLRGVLFGVRCTVDMLFLRNLGYEHVGMLHRAAYASLFLIVIFAVIELIRNTERPGPATLGCICVLLPYAMTLPFRAWVQYDHFMEWNRYQLFPQVGVALLMCAALQTCGPRWLLAPDFSRRNVLFVLALASAQFLVHSSWQLY